MECDIYVMNFGNKENNLDGIGQELIQKVTREILECAKAGLEAESAPWRDQQRIKWSIGKIIWMEQVRN